MEKMADFFARRADGYDEHMLNNVEGCREAYEKLAELIPAEVKELLDLGCGTGLELDSIFKLYPDVAVTGIDITEEMLEKLREKYKDKQITLINGDYFNTDIGQCRFDAAISFQTMHHFNHEMKTGLYKKVFDSLRNGGCYIECDYMVETQEEEEYWFSENARIRGELNIPKNVLYHYDTPCTIRNQITMLLRAGFVHVEKVFRIGNTTILTARKEIL